MLTFAINNTAFRELVDEFPEALAPAAGNGGMELCPKMGFTARKKTSHWRQHDDKPKGFGWYWGKVSDTLFSDKPK
jgi:hypothetical protein